ncbi:MAG: Ig-like domain-containing protein [Gemmatimonadaceae bacterium]
MSMSNLTSGRVWFAPASALRRSSLLAVAALLLPIVACQKSATGNSARVASIDISPASLTLSAGAAQPLSASVRDENGSRVSAQVFWATQDSRIATVSPQGVVSGVAPGRTQIAASKGGISAVVPVTVSALPAALVRVLPTTSTIDVGKSDTLTADVLDSGGRLMKGQVVAWSSANVAITTVSSNGVITGVAPGTVVITAATAGLTGTAVVTVRQSPVSTVSVAPASGTVQVGKMLQLAVTLRDAAGNVVSGRPVTWTSDNLTRAAVLPNGVVTGINKGNVTIRATSDGRTGSATVQVK